MKPRTPIQAEIRWIMGFSKVADTLSPILCRKDVNVNVKKNNAEKDSATAMKTGVDGAGGDSNKAGTFPGKTLRLYDGDTDGSVQFRLAEFVRREHDPSTPRNTLGPSTFVTWTEVKLVEGVTVSKARRSCSNTTGARNVKSDKSTAVNASRGARCKVAALERPAIIVGAMSTRRRSEQRILSEH